MTWEELKEEAKKIGASIYISPFEDNFERIGFKNANFFNDNGEKYIAVETKSGFAIFAENRTPSQMLAIMKALQ